MVARRMLSRIPTGKDHAFYAQCLRSGVKEFFDEGVKGRNLLNWLSGFHDYSGDYDLGYVKSTIINGVNLRDAVRVMPKSSLIGLIFSCFNEQINYGQIFERNLCRKLDGANTKQIYAILMALDLSMSKRHVNARTDDFDVLSTLAQKLWLHSSMIGGSIKHDTIANRYVVDGRKLRLFLAEETERSGLKFTDNSVERKSEGWPDSFYFPISGSGRWGIKPLWP